AIFEWDTLFTALMAGTMDLNGSTNGKLLAIHTFLAIIKGKYMAADGTIFFPNFKTFEGYSTDRSQSAIAARVLYNLFMNYGWNDPDILYLASLVIDDINNALNWMWRNRQVPDGSYLLTLGSNQNSGSVAAAILESGMDNSPMYINAAYNQTSYLINIYDIGVSSLFVSDCQALVTILQNTNLGTSYISLLQSRSALTTASIQSKMYSNGIYQNQFYGGNSPVDTVNISPTSFYPMIAGIASSAQVDSFITNYLFHPSKFCLSGMKCANGVQYSIPTISISTTQWTNNYWQGIVWGPTNMLLYWSLSNPI